MLELAKELDEEEHRLRHLEQRIGPNRGQIKIDARPAPVETTHG